MNALQRIRQALLRQPMTVRQLVQETGLARRTVSGAIQQLRLQGTLQEQVSLRDARQTWMWLPGTRQG